MKKKKLIKHLLTSNVEIELVNNRIVPNSMETRGAIASYNIENNKYELRF